jgi:hypothetical protein
LKKLLAGSVASGNVGNVQAAIDRPVNAIAFDHHLK